MSLPDNEITQNEQGRLPDPTQGDTIIPSPKPFVPSFGENFGTGGYSGDQTGNNANDQDVAKMLSLSQAPPPKLSQESTFKFMPSQVDPTNTYKYNTWLFGQNNEELAHQLQSPMDRFGNWGVGLVGKTLAYATQGIGFLLGAPAAAITGDVGNMTDNFLVKMGDNLKEGIQQDFPIYKGSRYTNGNIWQKLTSWDWWLDDATDRVALTASMFLPGIAEAKGFGLAALASKGLKAVAENPESYSFLSKTFLPKLYKAATTGTVDEGVAPALASYATNLRRAELYTWNVISQSGMNAMETSNAIKKYLIDERSNGGNTLSDDEIKQKAAVGAQKSFWETVPITLAGSLVEIPAMFSTLRSGKSVLDKLYNPATAEALAGGLSAETKSIKNTLWKAATTGFEHGQNESMQVAISRYNEENLTGRDNRGTLPGIFGDFVDNINDPNGQNNIALGTIQGILMSMGGVYGARYTKAGKQDAAVYQAQKQSTFDIINRAKLQRSYTNGDFVLRGEDGKPVVQNGETKLDQSKLADAGLSLDGVQRRIELRKAAIEAGDSQTLDALNHQSLASFAYNFFGDPNGMAHLNGILSVEAKQAKLDPDRLNDIDEHGNEITPELQLEKNLSIVSKLKRNYDALDERHAGFTDLKIDPKDKIEVQKAGKFLQDLKFTQYNEAAKQSFLANQFAKNESELMQLGIGKEDMEKPFESPSNPQEEKFNTTLENQKYIKEDLQASKDTYKKIIDKQEWIKAFKDQKDFDQSVKDIVGTGKTPENAAEGTNIPVRGGNMEIGKQYQLQEPILREGNKLHISPTLQVLSPTFNRKFHVATPGGETSILSSREIGKYNVDFGPQRDTKSFDKLANDAITKVLDRNKWTSIQEKAPKDLQGRLKTINQEDNSDLADDIQSQIAKDTKDWVELQRKLAEENAKLEKYKKVFFKQQQEIQGGSGTNATGSEQEGPEESQKKATDILYISTTSPSKDLKPHQVREQVFFNNVKNFPNKRDIKAILFVPHQEASLGLTGITSQLIKGTEYEGKETDPDNAPLMVVQVEDSTDSRYFVDKEGKRIGKIGETPNLNNVIISTMPTTSLKWRNGEDRFRNGEAEVAEEKSDAYLEFRKKLLASKPDEYSIHDYTISRGQPVEVQTIDGKKERVPVTKGLIPQSQIDRDGLIAIPDNGVISHNGEAISFPLGRPVLQFEDTLVFLNNRRFTEKEANLLYNLLYKLSEEPDKLNAQITNFLRNILFWGKVEGKSSGRNQVYLDTDTGDIVLGNNEIRIPFTPGNLEAKKEDLISFFQLSYNSVNNNTLKVKKNDPFEEITGISKDGEIESRMWKNYQRYLLSDKFEPYNSAEVGGKRDTETLPLFTHIRPLNQAIENDYNFVQKYITLQGIELKTKKVEPKKKTGEEIPFEEIKPGIYTSDGKTSNIYVTSKGEKILFTYSDPSELNITTNDEYTKAIDRISKVEAAIKSFRDQGATGTDTEVADIILRVAISQDITKKAPIKETPPPTDNDGKTLKGTGKGKREFSVATDMTLPRMTEGDYELFKEWHKKNVPGIPFERLENMVSVNPTKKAWGVFEDGVAKFYKAAAKGTEYHEAFEGVWAGFLPEAQKQAILDEMKERKGQLRDKLTGQLLPYFAATDKQLKEKIADEFADYRLSKMSPLSLGDKLRDFFRSILRFFKAFLGNKSLKNDLFDKINTGFYKNSVLPDQIKELAPEYSVAGLDEEETHLAIQDIAARAFSFIFGDDSKSLWNLQPVTVDEVFNSAKEEWKESGKLDVVWEEGWKQLVNKTKDFLKTFRIEFDETNTVTINDEGKNKNDYSPEAFTTDVKKSSPYPVKILTFTLPKTDPKLGRIDGLQLTALKNTSINGVELVNYSKAFINVMNKVTGSNSLDGVVSKLSDLAKDDPDFERLVKRIGADYTTGQVNYGKLDKDDWRTLVSFQSVFSKHKYIPYAQYIDADQVYTGTSVLKAVAKQVTSDWFENMKGLSEDKDSFIQFNKSTRAYSVTSEISKQEIKTPEQREKFLANMGIIFPKEVFNRLKIQDKNKAIDAIAAIKTYVAKAQDIMSISGKTLGINGPLNTLSELYAKVTTPNQESTFFNAEGEARQLFENPNYVSTFENTFNNSLTLDDLLNSIPQIKNDVFSRNSLILKKGGLFFDENGKRIKEIKIGYADGTVYRDEDYGTSTKRMLAPDRMIQEFNHNINGIQYILLPADGSTEWTIELGNNVAFSEFSNPGNVWQKVYSIFTDYLQDEVNLAREDRKQVSSVAKRSNKLRFFDDILDSDTKNKIETVIKGNETFENFINSNKDKVNESIGEFIKNTIKETKKILENGGKLIDNGDNTFGIDYLDSTFANAESLNKSNLTDQEVNRIIAYRNINSIIGIIELHKVIYGDPYQFEIKEKALDETKRIKMSLSPRRALHVSNQFNNFANEEYNKVNGKKVPEGLPGHHTFKDYVSTSTISLLNGENVVGETYFSELPDEMKDLYQDTTEADSFSYMLGDNYREAKLRIGQWDNMANEDFYQYDAAFTRQAFLKKGIIDEEKYPKWLQNADIALIEKGKPTFYQEVMKPIVFGNKYGSQNIDIVGDKLAQLPIFYSLLKDGSTLKSLHEKMWKEGRGYVILKSGRKVGSESIHDIYSSDGSLNKEPFNNEVKVGWNTWSFQLENSYDESKKKNTLGSQTRKIATVDLMEGGKPIDAKKDWESLSDEQKLKQSPVYKMVQWHQQVDEALVDQGYNELLNKLGIVDTGGEYVMDNAEKAAKTLQDEIKRRALSDNANDSISIDPITKEFKIPAEASPKYRQIRDILYSMVDKSLIRPKVNGGMKVQIPSTMWENAKEGRGLVYKKSGKWTKISKEDAEKLSDTEKKSLRLTSSKLHWYTKEEPYIGVMLPHWFGEKVRSTGRPDEEVLKYLNKTQEGRDILTGIGFRIPTQHISSIEVFRVEGFLPQEYGDTIVVPSEITVKAGSDFDIDKLNTYLKNVYIDKDGNPRLIKLSNIDTNNEDKLKDFYEDNVLEKHKAFKEKEKQAEKEATSKEFLKKILGDAPEGIEDEDTSDLNEIRKSYIPSLDEFILENKGKDIFDLNREWGKFNYRKALENEYFSSMQNILQLPENYERLLTPTTEGGLKVISEKITKLLGEDIKGQSVSNIINPNYISSLRNDFLTAKRWIAIVALNITNHSLTQRQNTYIDVTRAPFKDKKWLGNGELILPHNTSKIGDKDYISLSNIGNVKDEYISNVLSSFGTATVDAPKDPFILKIVPSQTAINIALYMVRIGTDKEQIGMFLNQPILKKYFAMLDADNSTYLFNEKKINSLVSMFPTSERMDFVPSTLANNISSYVEGKTFSDAENAQQQSVLAQFLKYAKMSEHLTDFMLSTNYDTQRYRSSDDFYKKNIRTDISDVSNIIVSSRGLLANSFIGKQAEKINASNSALSTILVFERPEVRQVLDQIMEPYANDKFMSSDDYQRIADKVRYSFLDYLVQSVRFINSAIYSDMADLETSVAAKVVRAKKEFPEKNLLQVLNATGLDPNSKAKNLKVLANIKDAYDENLYAGYFRELREDTRTKDLYYQIVRLGMLQGSENSPISFTNLIPFEDYAAIVAPVLAKLDTLPATFLQSFVDNSAFQRNNWRDTAIVPKVIMRERFDRQKYVYLNVPDLLKKAFPSATVVAISAKYNSKQVQYPVIKFQYENPTIQVGKRSEMRKRGDYSYMVTRLYKQVMENDEPLTTADGTNYIYKEINGWGDGFKAKEYWETGRPSVLDNGTLKVVEVPDEAIINAYRGGDNNDGQELLVTPPPVEPTPSKTPEFDKLPSKSTILTMTYTGIGSRETPKNVQAQMTELAKELENKGYTLRTGDAPAADESFRKGTEKKEVYKANDANDKTRAIAREIHPNPFAMDRSKNPAYIWGLMARNTNQVFGKNLDTPSDFIIAWTKDGIEDGKNRTQLSGGTGQAIDMASRKGIPVINMKNADWRSKLDAILSGGKLSPEEGTEGIC